MALVFKDRVLEASTTTGTGDITLAGAYTGFRAFSAVCSTGDVVYYLIEAVDSNGVPTGDWETGYGTYSAANTLTRTVVADSSTGSVVSFAAGTKRVSICATATYQRFRGALVGKTTAQSGNFTASATTLTWDTETYDTDAFHDNVTNNTRLTVPSNVSLVRITSGVFIGSFTSANNSRAHLKKNGALFIGGSRSGSVAFPDTTAGHSLVSSVVSVVSGDYFEVEVAVATDTAVDLTTSSWFAIEVIA